MGRNPEKAPQDALRAHFGCGEGEGGSRLA